MKILIADDSQVMRRIVMRALRQAGFGDHQLIEAETGEQTLALVDAERPDLVLSDWELPGTSGIEALTTLRAAGSSVPFGFVTAAASDTVRRRAAAAGALFVIPKPITARLLRDALDRYLPAVS